MRLRHENFLILILQSDKLNTAYTTTPPVSRDPTPHKTPDIANSDGCIIIIHLIRLLNRPPDQVTQIRNIEDACDRFPSYFHKTKDISPANRFSFNIRFRSRLKFSMEYRTRCFKRLARIKRILWAAIPARNMAAACVRDHRIASVDRQWSDAPALWWPCLGHTTEGVHVNQVTAHAADAGEQFISIYEILFSSCQRQMCALRMYMKGFPRWKIPNRKFHKDSPLKKFFSRMKRCSQ